MLWQMMSHHSHGERQTHKHTHARTEQHTLEPTTLVQIRNNATHTITHTRVSRPYPLCGGRRGGRGQPLLRPGLVLLPHEEAGGHLGEVLGGGGEGCRLRAGVERRLGRGTRSVPSETRRMPC